MSDEHGRLEYKPTEMPSGIVAAAIRGCCLCGEIISGMGGGGDFIHKECWNKFCSGGVAQLKFDCDRAQRRVKELEAENQKLREAAQGLDSALDKYIEDTSKGESE